VCVVKFSKCLVTVKLPPARWRHLPIFMCGLKWITLAKSPSIGRNLNLNLKVTFCPVDILILIFVTSETFFEMHYAKNCNNFHSECVSDAVIDTPMCTSSYDKGYLIRHSYTLTFSCFERQICLDLCCRFRLL